MHPEQIAALVEPSNHPANERIDKDVLPCAALVVKQVAALRSLRAEGGGVDGSFPQDFAPDRRRTAGS